VITPLTFTFLTSHSLSPLSFLIIKTIPNRTSPYLTSPNQTTANINIISKPNPTLPNPTSPNQTTSHRIHFFDEMKIIYF